MHKSFIESLMAYENIWMLHIFGIILVTTAISFASGFFLRQLKRQAGKTTSFWDDAAIAAGEKPLRVLVWVLGLNAASLVVASHSGSKLFTYTSNVRALLIIIILAWFLIRFISKVEEQLLNPETGGATVDVTSARAISKLLRISVIVTAALILLERLGYSVAGVMAFGGIGGIAVGFAAKDLLANFFGGLMIFLDRPFSIGDWIRSPDRNIEGTVEHIGWRQTLIRTPDKRPLYVPNSTFASIAVENPARMSHRRINEVIGLRYDDWEKLPVIAAKVQAMLDTHADIDQEQNRVVSLDKLSASSLDILVTAFTSTCSGPEFQAIKQDILLRIMKIVAEEGAEFAFPTQTLHMSTAGAPGTAA